MHLIRYYCERRNAEEVFMDFARLEIRVPGQDARFSEVCWFDAGADMRPLSSRSFGGSVNQVRACRAGVKAAFQVLAAEERMSLPCGTAGGQLPVVK